MSSSSIIPDCYFRFRSTMVAPVKSYCAKLVTYDAFEACSEKQRKPPDKFRCQVVAELHTEAVDSISGSASTPLSERRYKMAFVRQTRRYIPQKKFVLTPQLHTCVSDVTKSDAVPQETSRPTTAILFPVPVCHRPPLATFIMRGNRQNGRF